MKHITGLAHIALFTKDLETSIKFYECLGGKVTGQADVQKPLGTNHITADQGITIFVTTHYMDEAEYCDRISMMVAGHIRALDTPDGLKYRFNARDMDEVFQKLAREAQRGEHAFTHTQTEQP